MEDLLCHICGKMFNYMENLKRHLVSHRNKYDCPDCKYSSPRKDTLKRHFKTHNRQILSNLNQRPEASNEKTRLETKAYQADPTNMNSYIYQQSLPKNKEIFPWILHELDTQARNSRPYYQLDPIIIPLETNELLQDPRPHQNPINIPPKETQVQDPELSLSDEIDYLLSQEYVISASLSELDMMLRNLESEDIPLLNREEETNGKEEDTWRLIDII